MTEFNPKLDLKLERVIDVPAEAVWNAWTTPKLLMPWFCPKPWQTTECEIDLRPGGKFHTVMRGPAGEVHPNIGCYLEVVPGKKLVWTSALEPGFRPGNASVIGMPFTAVITLEPHGTGTKYTAIAMHSNEADQAKHAEMGFEHGWGTVLDQLVAFIKAG